MTSKALLQGAFIVPKPSLDDVSPEQRTTGRRHPSVYDAVAGIYLSAPFVDSY